MLQWKLGDGLCSCPPGWPCPVLGRTCPPLAIGRPVAMPMPFAAADPPQPVLPCSALHGCAWPSGFPSRINKGRRRDYGSTSSTHVLNLTAAEHPGDRGHGRAALARLWAPGARPTASAVALYRTSCSRDSHPTAASGGVSRPRQALRHSHDVGQPHLLGVVA